MKTIILSVVLSLFSLKVFSYSFTTDFDQGFYWQQFPIQMNTFVVDSSQGPLLASAFFQAASEWENAINENIWGIVNDYIVTSNFSGNFIRWSFNFGAETGYDQQSTLAVTTRYSEGTYMVRTDIILNGNHPTLINNWGGALNKVILHELGHTIGLGHSDDHSIMAASIGSIGQLQPDDVEGAEAAFNQHKFRQATGFVSPFAQESDKESNPFGGCGTIDVSNTPNSGGGLGIFLTFLFALAVTLRRRKEFVISFGH